jgi:hypothetical protein
LSALSDARKRLANYNIEFDARMEAQRQLETAAMSAAIDREVWALSDQGYSVAAIQREYGTKDFRTIKRILEKRVNRIAGPIIATVDGDVYDVRAYDEHVVFELMGDVPVFQTWRDDFLRNGKLTTEIRENPPFLTKIKEAAHA